MVVTKSKKNIARSVGNELHDLFREVFHLHEVLADVVDDVHREAGFTTAQHRVVMLLDRIGPATVPDLAAELGVSRQSVQKLCNSLLADNIIEFHDNPRHKRSKLAAMTKPGLAAFERAGKKEYRIIEQAMPGVDPARAKEARDLLHSIRRAIEESL